MNSFTLERFIKLALGLAGLALFFYLLYYFGTLVGYAIIAILITYLLDPVVNRIQTTGINRIWAIVLTLSTLILFLVWISTNIFPVIANQMVELAGQLNVQTIQDITQQVEDRLTRNFTFLPEHFLSTNITRMLQDLFDVGQLPTALSNLIGLFTNIFWAALVIPFATFFFLKDGTKIRRDILQLVPNKYFETTLSLIDKIETRLGHYFRSVMLQSFIVALTSWLLLSIVGLNNALSVGIAVGLANTIPYFGPAIGYLLSITVSIIEIGNFSLVLPCIIAIFLVQLLDNLVLQPVIFSRSAEIHPVAILFIIMIGAEIAGILGMLLAVPIATTTKITINQIRWSINNYYVFRSGQKPEA
ncbi:AI-2E family transporter [Fodinibius sediminis]|uniref:Predicted PurR-regulated permease PerM n=1 Tax=Fodinibius sediminis TaxID=1214077 RepID=A0A521E0G5_9BACT|nr:AI-2E family transporter [Fodinibius sediminis]SMO77372.1 Predicted PurR-regulated permease PerM [Fodinibius sediminis]